MIFAKRFLWPLALAPAILLGDTAQEAERSMRAGDSAFDRADYTSAIDAYAVAELGTPDPGLTAFNRATALYRLGNYRAAESFYTRCLEDAGGARLARTLFNLGNCLVQEARDTDASTLERAVAYYERCLREQALDRSLADDARANLAIAQALLVRAQAARGGRQNQKSRPDEQDPDARSGQRRSSAGNANSSDDQTPGSARGSRPDENTGDGEPRPISQTPPPGSGTLPPIPDRDELTPLSPEETAAYLQQIAARLLRERRGSRTRPAPASHVMDW